MKTEEDMYTSMYVCNFVNVVLLDLDCQTADFNSLSAY